MAFSYRNGVLHAEQASLEEIARRFGTPCYVYSRAIVESAFRQYASALAGREAMLCYSVKANSNLSLLRLLADLGCGFDIVSGGELERVLAAGGKAASTFFSGVGKTREEIVLALRQGIGCINVESEAELDRIDSAARELGCRAPVAFRVNPDVDARTHPYISTGLKTSKFGVAHAQAEALYARAAGLPGIEVVGIGCHIGSLLAEPAPLVEAVSKLCSLVDRLERAGITLRHIDVGGGIGIPYRDEVVAPIESFVAGVLSTLGTRRQRVVFDPGRSIVGNAGLLLTRVEYLKPGETRNFLVVDAAMNDLIRPSLYGAWHEIRPVRESAGPAAVYDVVGPVCESADFLAKDRSLRAAEGDYLAVMSAGAYGMCMSSNYNSRPRAAEVLVEGAKARLVRRREVMDDLLRLEAVDGANPG